MFVAPPLCIQEVSARLGIESQRKALAPGGLAAPLALAGLLEDPGLETVRCGRWGQERSKPSRRGAGPALALSLTGSGQCPAAKGRGPAYAHKLISSASAGLPAQSGCLHHGAASVFLLGGGAGGPGSGRKGE